MTFFGEIFLINFGGLTLQKSDVCIDILFILWEYKLYNSQIYIQITPFLFGDLMCNTKQFSEWHFPINLEKVATFTWDKP